MSTKKNIKTIEIIVPNELILDKIVKTPTFAKLSKMKLKVGSNVENVNHYQYSNMVRLYSLIGVKVNEVK
jgi:hypothetical protein